MGIEKTRAIILSLISYRESSTIVNLYTTGHGRIAGIAKGIRRNSKNSIPLERGSLIDLMIYVRNNRELHTLADIQISDYYPLIRGNLHKTAIRDAAFELILKSITLTEPHPELFFLLQQFLQTLQCTDTKECCFYLLWDFYFKAVELLGFATDFKACKVCGRDGLHNSGGFLVIESGGLFCRCCAQKKTLNDTFISGSILQKITGENSMLAISNRELIRITRIIASYCRFHLDIRHEFKTIEFIEQMTL